MAYMDTVMQKGRSYQLLEAAVQAHGQGRLAEAKGLYTQVLSLEPRNVEAMKRLAILLLQSGQTGEGYERAKVAQKLKPKSKSVMEIFAAAAAAAGDYTNAIRAFEMLVKIKPVNPAYFLELSKAEYELNNYKRATARYLEFLKHKGAPGPEDCFTLGRLYFRDRKPEEAAKWLDKAMGMGFENSELLAIRANCYIHVGDKDTAIQFFERSIALDPTNVEAHYQHRNLVKTEAGDPIFAHLEGLKGHPNVSGTPEVNLYFILGKMYQRIGEDAKAFENYQLANQKTATHYAAQGFTYNPPANAKEFELLKETFSKEAIEASGFEGHKNAAPVFIVGLPRSGTTLLEQIISAHPKAAGRGELEAMHYIHTELMQGLQSGKDLAGMLRANGRRWQKDYLAALAPEKGLEVLTDKLPANARSLGLISILFPKAKIIHIKRDPMAVGFSIFGNLFDYGHPYSTSLENIGDYIRQTRDLLTYWKGILGPSMLEVSYEDLVADQEVKSKEVVDFLGLDWDQACLAFHKQDTAAMTLSAIQVRKPMTNKAVDRWRRFEDQLEPLKTGLGDLVL